jgi:hypothetical protein
MNGEGYNFVKSDINSARRRYMLGLADAAEVIIDVLRRRGNE